MRDISNKVISFRIAIASSFLEMSSDLIELVKENEGPKKDIIPTAKAAAYLAVKNTATVIPHCHPIPIEDVTVDINYEDKGLKVLVEVKTAYKTGCEIEAMHGAQIAALTIYDMLKPLDKSIVIKETKLESKKGGKSDFKNQLIDGLKIAVIVISDSVSAGSKQDLAGKSIVDQLETLNATCSAYHIVADEANEIEAQIKTLTDDDFNLIITTGGTGLSPRDITPETVRPLLDREIEGVMEAARSYGQQKTPYAMLSRGVAGMIKKTVILTLPGSTRGARESMDALFPYLFHLFKVQKKAYQHHDIDNK